MRGFNMTNLGDVDRTVRMFAGAILGILLSALHLGDSARFWLGVAAVYLLTTALLGWCAVYALVRISTKSPNDAPAPKS